LEPGLRGGGVYGGHRRGALVRRRNEAGQALEQLEGCEAKRLATVQIELGEPVDQAGLGRRERRDAGGGVKPRTGERPPRAVPNEPLQTRSVVLLDADGAVDGRAAGPSPDPPSACARHVRCRGGVQEPTPGEPAQDAKRHRLRQGACVSGRESGGLVKAAPVLNVAGDHAIEGQHVVVVVRTEGAPEALREGDGSELRVGNRGRSTRTRVTERGPERPEEDGEHRTRHPRRLAQEGRLPKGRRDRKRRSTAVSSGVLESRYRSPGADEVSLRPELLTRGHHPEWRPHLPTRRIAPWIRREGGRRDRESSRPGTFPRLPGHQKAPALPTFAEAPWTTRISR